MKVKILKEHAAGKKGDIVDVNFPGGDQQEYVDNGFIEILEEDKPKQKKIKSKTIDKSNNQLSLQQIKDELWKALDLEPLEQDDKLKELAKNSDYDIKRLKEQLSVFQQEIINRNKTQSKKAGKKFSKAQYDLLKFHSISGNEQIKQAIKEGIDFINANEAVRAHCRSFLDQIEKRIQKEKSVKFKYLELTSGRDKDWALATEVLRDYIMQEMHIYTTKEDKNNEVWVYNNGIYIPSGKSEIKEKLRKLLGEQYNQFVYNKVWDKIEPDTYIDTKEFFSTNHKYLIPVLNGILDLETFTLKSYDPSLIFFGKINAEYKPKAKCPKINEFLKQVLKDEGDINVFYELLGFGLIKEYKYEKSFMMIGDGRNGKGKTIELIKRLFGMENCCSVPISSMCSESFFISELFGKLFNLAGEINNQDLKDTSTFKSLTGRDLVNAHRKFQKDISFENYAKMVFACNELPMVYDMTKGFWDRWVLLEFPYTFVPEEEYNKSKDKKLLKIRDPSIIEKIITPEEMSGLLNEAIIGLKRLIKNKTFSSSIGTNEVKSMWIRKSNSFLAFCFDNIESCSDGIVSKKKLRKFYIDYCNQHKINPKSDYVIRRALQDTYGATEDRFNLTGVMWEHCWAGIKLKNIIKC